MNAIFEPIVVPPGTPAERELRCGKCEKRIGDAAFIGRVTIHCRDRRCREVNVYVSQNGRDVANIHYPHPATDR